jgi:transposase
MSLQPQPIGAVPEETARIAQRAFPKRNLCLRLRDELGTLYNDEMFAPLFSMRGQPAESAWRLALVLVLQFAEGLTDRQAADAVRGRIDWKYLLGLAIDDPGFDPSVLCEFRARILAGSLEAQFLDALLNVCKKRGLLKGCGMQRTDSTHVIAAIRVVTRLELVGETVRAALNSLSMVAPDWLRVQVDAEWFDRYSHRVESYRLPKQAEACRQLAVTMGQDGVRLLSAISDPATPRWLRQVPAVEVLRRIWIQQYIVDDGQLRWRKSDELPPGSRLICSPYDIEARYSKKRTTEWTGYKVHLTETCDADQPHLITQVETTLATTPDGAVVSAIQQSLAERELLPTDHLMDTGYVDAGVLVTSQAQHGVAVCGPVPPDTTWQKRAGEGFDLACFTVDWEAEQVRCPHGKTSTQWLTHKDRHGNQCVSVRFAKADCQACPVKAACTKGENMGRQLGLRPRAQFEALQVARTRQITEEFKQQYARRAGIEATISLGVRIGELRRSRYRGQAKTHLQHVLMAVALNLGRLAVWWQEQSEGPLRSIQPPRFANLANHLQSTGLAGAA